MKKYLKCVVICLSLFMIAILIFFLWEFDAFIIDRSAKISFENVSWNDKNYSIINGDYTEGRTIAKSQDGNWKINEVEEDPSHIFIVARSFLDQCLYVSDDYVVPTSGKLTTVSWNEKYITDTSFLDAMSKIEAEKITSFTYETDAIFHLTENQHMRPLFFSYENCPVATNFKGYMGKVNGEWVITTYISPDTNNADGSHKMHPVSCYVIPDEYRGILEKYFS